MYYILGIFVSLLVKVYYILGIFVSLLVKVWHILKLKCLTNRLKCGTL
nr:MAG TPA: hypothetical protein [Bacteriophage sp.]